MIELSMVSTAADLQRFLDDLDRRLDGHPLSPRRKYAVRLALDELLSNIVKYAHDDSAGHPVAIRLDLDDPASLTIADDGRPFDPLRDAPAPVLAGSAADRPVGGLGLHLLRALGLRLAYRREGGRNLLRVEFPAE